MSEPNENMKKFFNNVRKDFKKPTIDEEEKYNPLKDALSRRVKKDSEEGSSG